MGSAGLEAATAGEEQLSTTVAATAVESTATGTATNSASPHSKAVSLELIAAPIAVLAGSMFLEGKAAYVSRNEILGIIKEKNLNMSLWQYLRTGTDVMSVATFLEASFGVVGGGVGIAGLGYAYMTQSMLCESNWAWGQSFLHKFLLFLLFFDLVFRSCPL